MQENLRTPNSRPLLASGDLQEPMGHLESLLLVAEAMAIQSTNIPHFLPNRIHMIQVSDAAAQKSEKEGSLSLVAAD